MGSVAQTAPPLVVTTDPTPTDTRIARAQRVAAHCEARYIPRNGTVARTLRESGAEHAYVVGALRDELRGPGTTVHVHPGMLVQRLAGGTHPLVEAVAGRDVTGPRTILDATLGLGQDALHLAAACGATVLGLEASAVLQCLLEEGMARLSAGPEPVASAARRVQVRGGDARGVLAAIDPGAADVVYLDPMFEEAAPAASGFELIRRFAHHGADAWELVRLAHRVATRRVVLRVPSGTRPLEDGSRRVRGHRVDYLVWER